MESISLSNSRHRFNLIVENGRCWKWLLLDQLIETLEKATIVIFTSGKILAMNYLQMCLSNVSGIMIRLILDGLEVNGRVFLFNLFIYLDFAGVRVLKKYL